MVKTSMLNLHEKSEQNKAGQNLIVEETVQSGSVII